jgi:hypothetical protein
MYFQQCPTIQSILILVPETTKKFDNTKLLERHSALTHPKSVNKYRLMSVEFSDRSKTARNYFWTGNGLRYTPCDFLGHRTINETSQNNSCFNVLTSAKKILTTHVLFECSTKVTARRNSPQIMWQWNAGQVDANILVYLTLCNDQRRPENAPK